MTTNYKDFLKEHPDCDRRVELKPGFHLYISFQFSMHTQIKKKKNLFILIMVSERKSYFYLLRFSLYFHGRKVFFVLKSPKLNAQLYLSFVNILIILGFY